MISITCTGCGKGLRIKDELAGKKGNCPNCGQALQIPAAAPAPTAKAPPVEEIKPQSAPAPLASDDDLFDVPADAGSFEEFPDFTEDFEAAFAPKKKKSSTQQSSNKKKSSTRKNEAEQPADGGRFAKIPGGIVTVAVAAGGLVVVTLWLLGVFGGGGGTSGPALASHASDPIPEPVDTSALTFSAASDEMLPFYLARAVAYSPNGSMLIVAGTREDESPIIVSWDAHTWTRLKQADAAGEYTLLAFAPDGQTLYAATGMDNHVDVLDVNTLEKQRDLTHAGQIFGLSVAKNGTVATASVDDWRIQLWNDGQKGALWNG